MSVSNETRNLLVRLINRIEDDFTREAELSSIIVRFDEDHGVYEVSLRFRPLEGPVLCNTKSCDVKFVL